MRRYLLLFLVLTFSVVDAQDQLEFKDYDWEKEVRIPTLDSSDQALSQVIVKELIAYEYAVDVSMGVSRYKTFHTQVVLNDDVGIERNNKVYIPVRSQKSIKVLKARAISPKGEVKVIKEDNFKFVENLENYGSFMIFAFEGLEKGSLIEYFYTIKQDNPMFRGSNFIDQGQKVLEYEFKLIAPDNLEFDVTGVDGVELVSTDEKNIFTYKAQDIKAYKPEKYAAGDANKRRIDFNLTTIHSKDGAEKSSNQDWKAAANAFSKKYLTYESKPLKKFKKSLKTMGVSNNMTTKEKVVAIENYVKDQHNFHFDENVYNENILDVFDSKRVGEVDLIHMFCYYFDAAGVDFQLVFTSDRFESRFPKDKENWIYLKELMMYIPSLDLYLGPSQIQYRLGIVHSTLTENYGLFIYDKKVTDKIVSPAYEVKWIEGTKMDDNASIMELDITFDDIEKPKVKLKDVYKGHEGSYFKFNATYGEEERLKEYYEALMKGKLGEDADISSIEAKGTALSTSAIDDPFTLISEATVSSLVDNAGKEYLFNIGDVIGEQVQMYQEEERKYYAEVQFPHYYKRTIRFTVPEGYEVSGLEDLNMNIVKGSQGDDSTMGFVSKYKAEGAVVTVDVFEYYKDVVYPLDQFEDFRTVINTAADFNKIVVVFSEK